MADRMHLSRSEMRDLARRVLSFSSADQARVNISSGVDGNTRFAVNQITTGGDMADVSVSISSAFGRQIGSASTNRLDDEALERAVTASERLARLAPEDPEYLGELGPQEYAEPEALFEATRDLAPQSRAEALAGVLDEARTRELTASGFLSHRAGSSAVATSEGLFAFQEDSRASFTTTVRTPDGTGSGWAGGSAHDWSDLDPDALGRRAIDKAERSRNPGAIEPGYWTVIMEPTAVSNVVARMMGALDARSADEGRSYFSRPGGANRIGEQFVDSRVTIFSDPEDPRLFSSPFDSQGLPNRRMTWVEDGVLRNLVYDRYWAQRSGREPTGFPSGYYMEGGSHTLEDMIASTQRGLLLTRLWYIRSVDPRSLLFTGLTRDGTFLIENGQVTHPVQNLRWNDSPIFCLNNIEMMGEPVPASTGLGPPAIVPPLKIRDFTFTSLSDAV